MGLRQGTGAQYALTTVEVLGLCAIIVAGFLGPAAAPRRRPAAGRLAARASASRPCSCCSPSAGGARPRTSRRSFAIAAAAWCTPWRGDSALLTVLYLLANAAYLRALGHAGVAASEAVGADVMRQAVGGVGAAIVSLIVIVVRALLGQRDHDHRRPQQLRPRPRHSALRIPRGVARGGQHAEGRVSAPGRGRAGARRLRRGGPQRFRGDGRLHRARLLDDPARYRRVGDRAAPCGIPAPSGLSGCPSTR